MINVRNSFSFFIDRSTFFRIFWLIESSKELRLFFYIIKVFNTAFDQFMILAEWKY